MIDEAVTGMSGRLAVRPDVPVRGGRLQPDEDAQPSGRKRTGKMHSVRIKRLSDGPKASNIYCTKRVAKLRPSGFLGQDDSPDQRAKQFDTFKEVSQGFNRIDRHFGRKRLEEFLRVGHVANAVYTCIFLLS